MKYTPTLRRSRIRAFGMLLVWAFGLISGVANACLLEAPAGAAQFEHHDGKHAAVAAHLHIEASPSQAEAEGAHTSKQPCLKVCDDSSRSLPKKYPAGQTDLGLPTVVAVLWSLVEPVYMSAQQPDNTQRIAPHVPLRHRFSRLAL